MKNMGGISLGQQKSIQLVVIGEAYYLIGVGDDIRLLKEITDTEEINKLVEFYKKEMPARGWQENMNLRSGGAVLAYSKEGKNVLIGISKQSDETLLSLTVTSVGK